MKPGRDFRGRVFCWRGRRWRSQPRRKREPAKPATQLVHGGTLRSQFGETSEAMFLTQGFVYDSAEAAEARFKGEEPGFIYSRYANPTVDMFEKRMCAAGRRRGRRAPRRPAWRRSPRRSSACCEGRRPRRGGARAVRLVPLGDRDLAAALRHRVDAGRRHRPRGTGKRRCRPNTKAVLPGEPDQPDARGDRHRRRRRRSPMRSARGSSSTTSSPRRCSRSRWSSAPTSSSIPPPSTSTARAAASAASSSSDKKWIDENLHDYFRHTGPSLAVQRLDAAQGAGDAAAARRAADRERGERRRLPRRTARR